MFNCTEFAEGGFSDDEGYTQSDDDTCAMVSSNTSKNVLVILSFMFSVLVGTFNAVLLESWSHPRHQVMCVMGAHLALCMYCVSGILCTYVRVYVQNVVFFTLLEESHC